MKDRKHTRTRISAEQNWLAFIGTIADAKLLDNDYSNSNDRARLGCIRLAVKYALNGQTVAVGNGPNIVEVAAKVDRMDARLVEVERQVVDYALTNLQKKGGG